jgi:uncharacterized protein YbaA (DUF1428 family)
MAKYVDGFVIPVPKKNLAAYRKLSAKAGKVWMEYGALQYVECAGDDLNIKGVMSFPKQLKVKPGETVVFAWIAYASKAQRDRVNKRVMKDPRLATMSAKNSPFDVKRMCYGGFKAIVEY